MLYMTEAGRRRADHAKRILAHYFSHALGGGLPSDGDAEIGDAVDGLIEAAVAEVRGQLLPRDLGERISRLEARLQRLEARPED